MLAMMDQIAREVVEAHSQIQERRDQISTARLGAEAALASHRQNLDRIEEAKGLPIEVLQSIQALAQARREYLRTVIDYNTAQFTLYRALGWPVKSPAQFGAPRPIRTSSGDYRRRRWPQRTSAKHGLKYHLEGCAS